MFSPVRLQVPAVGILVGEFAEQSGDNREKSLHSSSGRKFEITNGASLTRASRVPRKIPAHTLNESMRIAATSTRNAPHITASSRALKISVQVSAVWATVMVPAASAACNRSACARNPSAGSGEKIFCHPAVKHTTTSHTSGTHVTHM